MKLLIELFDFSITLYWCPAHVDIAENEEVDQLAKVATEGNHLRLNNFQRSLSNIQQLAKQKFKFIKEKKSITRNNIILSNHPIKIFESLKKLERGESSIIYQLRSGHSPLNKYLHSIKRSETPNCNHCKKEEDVAHYLIKCSKYSAQRRIFRQTITAEKIKINPNSIKDILDTPKVFQSLANFILTTKRFENLRTYQDHTEE
jgi:hypothetical protein